MLFFGGGVERGGLFFSCLIEPNSNRINHRGNQFFWLQKVLPNKI